MPAAVEEAICEIESLVLDQFPKAQFETLSGDDPAGIYLFVTVDVDDVDVVIDAYAARLLELQIEDELPLYVVPVRPVERARDDDTSGVTRASALAD